jgi:mono/diheme cytochrome c family protein
MTSLARISAIFAALAATTACRQDMQNQPKYLPLQLSEFFRDGRSARPIPRGTVSREAPDPANPAISGMAGKEFLTVIPIPIDFAALERGQERYNIYCSPCHAYVGDGEGMVAIRGVRTPLNLLSERVRQEPPGYLFQVITNGFGGMPEYQNQIPPADRWRIVAYVRALQLSEGVSITQVPEIERIPLEAQPRPEAAPPYQQGGAR